MIELDTHKKKKVREKQKVERFYKFLVSVVAIASKQCLEPNFVHM